jgi:putative FmdB family regulatory protein
MPIYEYYCESCGHEFEVMQKITDRPIRKCESCGKLKAKRAISKSSFVLKGSGWYVTDYGGANASNRKSKSPPPAADASESAKDGAGKETGSKTSSSKKAANG